MIFYFFILGLLLKYKVLTIQGISPERVLQYKPTLRRSLFIVGLLLRFFDFTDKEVLADQISVSIKLDYYYFNIKRNQIRNTLLKWMKYYCFQEDLAKV